MVTPTWSKQSPDVNEAKFRHDTSNISTIRYTMRTIPAVPAANSAPREIPAAMGSIKENVKIPQF